ncbi:MAG TPA: winged helix-turn-helix domain-containing protein, partial [Acidimicrobiales bacterium]|nr:winged helix-turn-helix domain-containing protein [Acidimicrobiales bacterium]
MEFGILGQLEVSVGGHVVEVRPAKLRALLAVLLVHVNQVVSCDRLAEALWGESPPVSAANTLQGYVSHLRNILDPGRRGTATPLLQTVPSGYLLAVEAERVDAHR